MRNILQVVKRLSDFSPDSDLMKKWQKAQKKKEEKTDQPRPSNSWMVMLNVFRENRSVLVPDCLSPTLIASWLSTVKENATAHFHDRFAIAANKVKKSHQAFFPEYRYKPSQSTAARSGSKASSAHNPRSSSDSVSPSTSGSSSRSVKSTRTARKNASSPYPTHHASRTHSPQRQSGLEYHIASLGSWTDSLPLSSRPVGGVFLTNSAYESVACQDSPAFSQFTDHDSEATDGPARVAVPVDGAFEAALHKSSPSSPGPFAQPMPSNHLSPSAASFEQPFIGALAVVQPLPYMPPPSPQPQAGPSSPAHIARTTPPDYGSPLWAPHESSTSSSEFEGSFAGYGEPYTLSDESDTSLTPLDIATFADTMGSSHEPASPAQSSPHIGYTELSLPPGIPVASDLYALYDEPFVPNPSYEESLVPISGFDDVDDLFAGTRFGNAYWRNGVYVGGFEFGGSSAYWHTN